MSDPIFREGPLRRPFEILLVEDSPTDVLLATEALDAVHVAHRLHVVRDGVAACDFLHRRELHTAAPRPDLVLLDLNIPKKNGREILAEIKQNPDLRDIPVVVLTTSKADDDIRISYANHANCYITKPVDFDHFLRLIRDLVSFWFTVATLPSAPSRSQGARS